MRSAVMTKLFQEVPFLLHPWLLFPAFLLHVFLPPGVSGGGNSPQVIAVGFQLYIPAPRSCVAFCLKAGARKEWEQPRMYGEDL